jgi:D-alanyl-D-alanine carboxypeptidase
MKRGSFQFSLVFLPAILFFLVSFACTDNRPLEQQQQSVLDKGIQKYNVKGVSAAVIMPGRETWLGTAGLSHGSVPVEPGMVSAIGSITKNVVAALTLKLAEDGVLSLEDPLSRWLPEYPNVDSNVTIRQLLNHTSGIYMFWSNQQIWDDMKENREKIWAPEEVLAYINKPYFEPGQGFRYSNTNYLLLAMIIQKATGATLADELRGSFWQPLDLKDTWLAIQEEIPVNQIHIWGDNWNNDGSFLDMTFLPRDAHDSICFGSGSLFMTAENLARWGHFLFEGKILSSASMNEMLKFVDSGSGGNMEAYGLGVQKFRKKISGGENGVGHAGGGKGSVAYMVYLPEHQVTIAVLVNENNSRCSEYIVKTLIKKTVANLLQKGK